MLPSAILDEGEIVPESVDALLRSLRMPMGPYKTMDYSGLDIACHGGAYFAAIEGGCEQGPGAGRDSVQQADGCLVGSRYWPDHQKNRPRKACF